MTDNFFKPPLWTGGSEYAYAVGPTYLHDGYYPEIDAFIAGYSEIILVYSGDAQADLAGKVVYFHMTIVDPPGFTPNAWVNIKLSTDAIPGAHASWLPPGYGESPWPPPYTLLPGETLVISAVFPTTLPHCSLYFSSPYYMGFNANVDIKIQASWTIGGTPFWTNFTGQQEQL